MSGEGGLRYVVGLECSKLVVHDDCTRRRYTQDTKDKHEAHFTSQSTNRAPTPPKIHTQVHQASVQMGVAFVGVLVLLCLLCLCMKSS